MSLLLLIGLLLNSFAHWNGPARMYDEIVVFGDSLSDDGNLFAMTYGALPPSPPYFGGRFSNGEVWVERLAASLGRRSDDVVLRNFAVGGAQTGDGWKEAPPSFPQGPVELRIPAMGAQISDYLSRSRPSKRTLVVLFGGSNDIFFGDAGNAAAVRSIGDHIRELRNAGARRFLVANVPPLELTPYGRSLDPGTQFFLGLAVADFNARLEEELRSVERGARVEIHSLDVNALFRDVVDDPAAYGFADTTTPAILPSPTLPCEAMDAFLFWDDVHPTRAGHAALAAEAHAILEDAATSSGSRSEPVPAPR